MTALSNEEKRKMLEDLNSMHNPEAVEDLYGNIPDGTYQARLDSIYFHKTKNDKNKLTIEFEIIRGSYQSRTVRKWCSLETADNLDFLTNDLRRLGIKKFDWLTVEDQFRNILDHHYEINLTTKGGFQNIYINKEITIVEEEPDSDIPF